MSNNTFLHLEALIESIDKIEEYSVEDKVTGWFLIYQADLTYEGVKIAWF